MSYTLSLDSVFNRRKNTIMSMQNGRAIHGNELLAHALEISQQLPDKAYAINLCQNRYLFTVAFLAAIIRKQINLLPPNQSSQTIANLLATHEPSYCLVDNENDARENDFFVNASQHEPLGRKFPTINSEQTVAISFTSGSTGKPKAIAKTWGEFQQGANLALQQLNITHQAMMVISTVPAQHMYGLETSLFWPFFSELAINSSRPFFPEDIRSNLSASSSPCLLISTPTHLQACVKAELQWENIELILASTASMPVALAEQIESRCNAPLIELFGSTETLSFASRRTCQTARWKLYQNMKLTKNLQGFSLSGGHLEASVTLDDQFDIIDDYSFKLIGRSSDLIKIAGKRASLIALNNLIISIDGVDDAVFYPTENGRLSAVVVSKLSKEAIFRELKKSIDEVFLPRPLHFVDELPRNKTSKIVKNELVQLIHNLSRV